MITSIDGSTEAEIRTRTALNIALLALDVIADGWPDPRQAAEIALKQLADRYGATPPNL